MSINIYPSIAKVKRNGVYENLPGFVQQSGNADIEAMIATKESSTIAQYAHPQGSYFILNDVLYQADVNIPVNGTIAVGTNCHVAVLADNVSQIENDVEDLRNTVDSIITTETSVNLFNKNASHLENKIISVTSATGELQNNTDYDVYYIPVEYGKTYSFEPAYQVTGTTYAKVVCLYNQDLSFAGKITDGTYDSTNHVTTFTNTNQNAKYVGLTVKKTRTNYVMFVEGEYPDTYQPYFEPITVIAPQTVNEDALTDSAKNSLVSEIVETSNVNLYDPNDSDIIANKVIDGYGTMQNADYAQVSGYIEIEPNVSYIFPVYDSKMGAGVARTVPIYDASKTFIERSAPSSVTSPTVYDSTTGMLTFSTTNPDAKYIRVNIPLRGQQALYIDIYHYFANFMVTKAPYPTTFYDFGNVKTINDDIEVTENVLRQKKALFYGDSICYGDADDGWAGRIGRKNSMLWQNLGITGATFQKNDVAACIAERPITVQNPDYIILEGGSNDADRIGNAINATPEGFGSFSWDNYGTDDETTYYGFDITTFCGAIEYTIKHMISACTGAKIGYIVVQKMGRSGQDFRPTANNRRRYFETAMDICQKWGIPVLNLWDGCYLNPYINQMYDAEAQTGEYYTDGQHLQPKGYEYITPIIEAWMETL